MKRIGLALAATLMLLPFALMLSGSLQSIMGVRAGTVLHLWPAHATLRNYQDIFQLPLIWSMFANSAIMVVGYTIPAIVVNGLVAYAFAFYKFRGKRVLFVVAMATVFVPASTIIIPRYLTMNVLGLVGIPAVLIMTVFWAPGIFMFRNYFESIPVSLVESARIDGAGDWAIFRRIILPLSKPMVGAAIVFQGIAALSEYLWQMLNLTDPGKQTLLVGLYASMYERFLRLQLQTGKVQDFGYSLAVAMVIMMPVLLIFMASSRYFIGKLTMGATKE